MSNVTPARLFRNLEDTVRVQVYARIDHFTLPGQEPVVFEILSCGGTLPRDDNERIEQQRLLAWIRGRFVRRPVKDFIEAYETVTGHITPPTTEEQVSVVWPTLNDKTIADCKAKFDNIENYKGFPYAPDVRWPGLSPVLGAPYRSALGDTYKEYADLCARGENVLPDLFAQAPAVGTYWRSRKTQLDFKVISVSRSASGLALTIQMVNLNRKDETVCSFVFRTQAGWANRFEPCFVTDMRPVPYSAVAASLREAARTSWRTTFRFAGLGSQNAAQRFALRHLEPRRFPIDEKSTGFFNPQGLKADEIPAILSEQEDFVDRLTRRAGFKPEGGKELPPAAGERYQSVIGARNIYRVIDTRRKRDSTYCYVLMEREHDGHRAMFTYTNHERWFQLWVPVVEQEESRVHRPNKPSITIVNTVNFKDVSNKLAGIGNQIRKTLERQRKATTAAYEQLEANALRHLRIVYRELDRRLPGWRENPNAVGAKPDGRYAGVFLDEVALAVRAIRTLTHQRNNASHDLQRANNDKGELLKAHTTYRQNIVALKKANEDLQELLNERRKEIESLQQQRQVWPAVGSVWRLKHNGLYVTVLDVNQNEKTVSLRINDESLRVKKLNVELLYAECDLCDANTPMFNSLAGLQCNAQWLSNKEREFATLFGEKVRMVVSEVEMGPYGDGITLREFSVKGFLQDIKP